MWSNLKKQKKCPCCGGKSKKNGTFRGTQRYRCETCGKQFQQKKKSKNISKKLWSEYVFDHATIAVLTRRYEKSEKWIRTKLDEHVLPPKIHNPREVVIIGDATHIGDAWILVVRVPSDKENIYVRELLTETTYAYQEAIQVLEKEGYIIKAFVGDGRIAIPWLFSDIPVQMCHFHQIQIIIRYTTRNPKLEPGKEILDLAKTLPSTDEDSFTDAFKLWCTTWDDFLKEKTIHPETQKWHYTHKKLRSARTSIKIHLPFLFTHLRYPELNIPNTTNSLEGTFKKLKVGLSIHSGMSHKKKVKLIRTLLFGVV